MSGFHLIINVINAVYDKTIALQTTLELLAFNTFNHGTPKTVMTIPIYIFQIRSSIYEMFHISLLNDYTRRKIYRIINNLHKT